MVAVLTIVGWLVLVALGTLTGLLVYQMVTDDRGHTAICGVAALAASCATVCVAGAIGALPSVAAILFGVATAVATVVMVGVISRLATGKHPLLRTLRGAVLVTQLAVREAWQAAHRTPSQPTPGDEAWHERSDQRSRKVVPLDTVADPASAAAPREIPPARMDPALDQTDPAPVLRGVVVPADHAQLASRITGFEPDDDSEFGEFLRGEGSGLLATADAWRHFADTLGDGIGLDPACVAAALEFADVIGDCAHDIALIGRRYMAVYGATKEAVAGGLVLPFEARKFLTGEAV